MRLVGHSYEYVSGVDKFASSAIIQKQNDLPGKKAMLKNVGYNALRWLSVVTIVPMAVAAVKKHARTEVKGNDRTISLETKDGLIVFSEAGVSGRADASAFFGKHCLLREDNARLN